MKMCRTIWKTNKEFRISYHVFVCEVRKKEEGLCIDI